MSESDQFRQYAEEALMWVAQSKTAEEKRLRLELARMWAQAAVASDSTTVVVNYMQAKHRAAL